AAAAARRRVRAAARGCPRPGRAAVAAHLQHLPRGPGPRRRPRRRRRRGLARGAGRPVSTAYGVPVDTTAVRSDLADLVARAARGELGDVPDVQRFDPRTHADYRAAAGLLLLTPAAAPDHGPPRAAPSHL